MSFGVAVARPREEAARPPSTVISSWSRLWRLRYSRVARGAQCVRKAVISRSNNSPPSPPPPPFARHRSKTYFFLARSTYWAQDETSKKSASLFGTQEKSFDGASRKSSWGYEARKKADEKREKGLKMMHCSSTVVVDGARLNHFRFKGLFQRGFFPCCCEKKTV